MTVDSSQAVVDVEREMSKNDCTSCKAVKKLRRKQAQFLKQEPHLSVNFLESPSQTVFVGNGGTQNGLSPELLVELVKEVFELGSQSDENDVTLCLPLAKDYCFLHFASVECAGTVVEALNGICLQHFCKSRRLDHLLLPSVLSGPPLHLYLCCVDRIPPELLQSASQGVETSTPELPVGLVLMPEFVSPEEETRLLTLFSTPRPSTQLSSNECCIVEREDRMHDDSSSEAGADKYTRIDKQTACPRQGSILTPTAEGRDSPGYPGVGSEVEVNSLKCQQPSSTLKHRRVTHYGYEFLYGSNNVDPDAPLPGGLPEVCKPLLGRLQEVGCIHNTPDQLTVNEYLPGAGIPPHVDTHSAFEDGIISVTLGSQAVMDFRHTDGRKVSVFLPRRSVLVMMGESRYLWTHGIPARKMDVVHPSLPGYAPSCSSPKAGTVRVLPRGTRVSLTFRKLRRPPKCCCGYQQHCDSASRVS